MNKSWIGITTQPRRVREAARSVPRGRRRTNYDPEADVLHVAFGAPGVRSDSSEEVAPGAFAGFDPDGNPIGIEVISVRRRSGAIAPLRAAAK